MGFPCPSWSAVHKFKSRRKPMRVLGHLVADFLRCEDGPTAVEYAVMLALIIVVCITAISALGSNASNTFQYVGNVVDTTSSSLLEALPLGTEHDVLSACPLPSQE